MLYIIGLGLNLKGMSKQGQESLRSCKKVYLESYTVDFPYSISELSEELEKKIIPLDREKVESLEIVDEAKKLDVALLVYGSPLFATTHISLIQEAKASRVKCKVIYGASIFDALGGTGLQLYKFGKITSMPKWDSQKSFEPDSFIKTIQENMSMKAHSLILVDIGLKFKDALEQLIKAAEKHKVKFKKLIVCSRLGTKKPRVIYKDIENLEGIFVDSPYCIVIPSKLHFLEKEVLEKKS